MMFVIIDWFNCLNGNFSSCQDLIMNVLPSIAQIWDHLGLKLSLCNRIRTTKMCLYRDFYIIRQCWMTSFYLSFSHYILWYSSFYNLSLLFFQFVHFLLQSLHFPWQLNYWYWQIQTEREQKPMIYLFRWPYSYNDKDDTLENYNY